MVLQNFCSQNHIPPTSVSYIGCCSSWAQIQDRDAATTHCHRWQAVDLGLARFPRLGLDQEIEDLGSDFI